MKIDINLSALDKSRIVTRTYQTQDGTEVTEKHYKAELFELKEPKTIASGDTWELQKTHFLKDELSKEEKQNQVKANFIGEGLEFKNKGDSIKEANAQNDITAQEIVSQEIEAESIPF